MTTKFRAPIGTEEERESGNLWPSTWIDATEHGTVYELGIHTGADLNNNPPGAHDSDRFAPVYAVADGTVIFAGMGRGTWGKLVVIEHILPDGDMVHSRYAHLDKIMVTANDLVVCGKQIGTIGNAEGRFAYHLHFDMAINNVLRRNPQHWAGHDAHAVAANYVDPLVFIRNHWELPDAAESNGGGMPPAVQEAAITMYVQVAVLNVRPQATTSSARVDTLRRGERVLVSERPIVESANRAWRRIVEGDFTGCFVAEYDDSALLLALTPPEPVVPPAPGGLRSVFATELRGLHGNAGGWAPKPLEVEVYRANQVRIAFVTAYQSGQAGLTVPLLRDAGVQHFVVRTTVGENDVAGLNNFVNVTQSRMQQYYDAIGSEGFYVQIHNEPNLAIEGWNSVWQDGRGFADWFLGVEERYRDLFPGVRIGFSPLSPGGGIDGERMSEDAFIDGAYRAIQASDWVAVHAYWQNADADDLVVPVDRWQEWFGAKPLLATEVGPVNGAKATPSNIRHAYAKFSEAGVAACIWLADHTQDERWKAASWTAQGLRL